VPLVYELTIATPGRVVYQGRAQSVVAPGVEGLFGVLAHHAPMAAELDTGGLEVVTEAGERVGFAVSGGVLEVKWEGVMVLADSAEAAGEIDVERARTARARAEERLRARAADVDLVRAQAALRRALNRLRVKDKRQGSLSDRPSTG
jgi:F-type H+-transporting ATPase subunit epsilon